MKVVQSNGDQKQVSLDIKRQMSDTFLMGVILAIIGGYIDAYTFFARGGVFANAQTGNMVLFGGYFFSGDWKQAWYHLIPIFAFVFGIVVAEVIKKRYKKHPIIHWRQIVIGMEILALLGVSFLPQGSYDVLANVLVSFVCSLQVESFRKVNGNAYATTMCTGNLRSATEQLYLYRQNKDKQALRSSLEYYGIILFFILGAGIGSVTARIFFERATLFACLGLGIVFLLLFYKKK